MSFLKDYEIFSGNNECPPMFHTWSAISALSSLVSRRVFVDMGLFKYYPSLYILLVGPPGVSKSTAMLISRSLIAEFPSIERSPASITKEAITQYMGHDDSPCEGRFSTPTGEIETYRHMSFYCNEFVTLLESGGNAAGLINFLTDIWNESDEFKVTTKTAGCDVIDKPFVNILGCMTTDKLTELYNQKIFSSGFNRRCIFVYSPTKGPPVPFPEVTKEQKQAWDRVVEKAKLISKLKGEFIFPKAVKTYWADWYNAFYEAKAHAVGKFKVDYLETKPEFILKIAMLLAVSEHPLDDSPLILEQGYIQTATDLLEMIEPNMHVTFEQSGKNQLSGLSVDIREYILRSPAPVTMPKIQAEFWSQAMPDKIVEIIDHLVTTNQVKKHTTPINSRVLTLISRLDYVLDVDLLKQQLANKEGGDSENATDQ